MMSHDATMFHVQVISTVSSVAFNFCGQNSVHSYMPIYQFASSLHVNVVSNQSIYIIYHIS